MERQPSTTTIDMEHYCTEHNTNYDKHEKNGKTWYSHKISGTDDWCNERNENPRSNKEWSKSLDKPNGMYACNALNNAIQLNIAGIIKADDVPAMTKRLYQILEEIG